MTFRLSMSCLAIVCLTACASNVRRFPLTTPVMWEDADRRPFSERPEGYFSGLWWDGADQMAFRPLVQMLSVGVETEATNVNAMDEVPNSSWYQNRLSRNRLSTERLIQAACDGTPLDENATWNIVAAKPNGANPGFIIEDPEGRKFLLKFDGADQPERPTSADVMGSIIYWGAGFHSPCNRVVFFDRDNLEIPEGTMAEIRTASGFIREPLTAELLEPIFEGQATMRLPNGRYRATASAFVPGRPIGPWRYEGVWDADPNDIIPHEERRELRGGYVLASWLNHFDSREQNTLAVWMEADADNGYVEHYYIDFGDCFGSLWPIEGVSRRLGHSAYMDLPHIAADFLTLGFIPRPWNNARLGPAGLRLGYYDVHRFEPDAWRPGYPNPSFQASTERDNAWMARIIARFRPEDVRALVDEAHIQHDVMRREVFRILMGRRQKILERWFRNLSPLTEPRVVASGTAHQLCMTDLALTTDLIESRDRPYTAHAWQHVEGSRVRTLDISGLVRHGVDEVCVDLPDTSAGATEPSYLMVDLTGYSSMADGHSMPARVHLYQTSEDEYVIVGLERPTSRDAPGREE